MEKITVNVEENLITNEVITLKEDVFPLLRKLVSGYAFLNIGKFDKAALIDICGRGKAKKSKEAYLKLVESDLNQMGINSPAVIKKFRNNAESDIENLIAIVEPLNQFTGIFDSFSIENEEPVITESDMNAIREKHTIFLSSEPAIQARELQIEVANKLSEFIQLINKKNKNLVFYSPYSVLNLFFSFDVDSLKYEALPTNFEKIVNK
jgi:hypothetical protein